MTPQIAFEHLWSVANLPLFEIERIGDAPPEPVGRGGADRPLAGTRVLDLSRIIAGPVAGRALAQHGAQVLLVNGLHLPNIAPLVIDNGRGKRSAAVDLRDADGRGTLRSLAGGADVFLQAYRPGSLAARGFAPEDVARLRPGIVYVSISAYGHAGPWATRRGFDSLVQSASGIAWTESRAACVDVPKHLPCQALQFCDRRATWRVRAARRNAVVLPPAVRPLAAQPSPYAADNLHSRPVGRVWSRVWMPNRLSSR